mmetsp:Transcript_51987/g.137939  ORF Transcript_51987/g.137939 Transcript_51987/m.137939 type:complete len:368 (-) Transcript_51987:569-1672(-)
MFKRCNASCMASSRRSLYEQRPTWPNPLVSEEKHQRRIQTFFPIFCLVFFLLLVYGAVYLFFGASLADWQREMEEALSRALVRMQRKYPRLGLLNMSATKVGSNMICVYYINEGFTVAQTNPLLASFLRFAFETDGVWQHHVAWVDAANLAAACAAMLCLFKIWPMQCAFVMMADTLADSYLLLWLVGMQWLSGRGLYVNELMAKKLSLLGCVAMMIATHNQVLNGRSLRAFLFPAHLPVLCPQANERSSSSFLSRGLLEVSALSNNISIAVLIGRLLIAVLFVYVGLHELHRLFFEPFTPYLPGDGHDVVWPKAVELLLAVPFILGFEVNEFRDTAQWRVNHLADQYHSFVADGRCRAITFHFTRA